MEIFFLGTGTSLPVQQQSLAGLFVKAGDRDLHLDIGPGSLTAGSAPVIVVAEKEVIIGRN